MRVRINLLRGALAALFILALMPIESRAQDDENFKVGERVEYKDSSYPESWKEGTVIKVHPEYKQVVVRWDPRPDYPAYTHNGVSTYEQAYSYTDVRHIKARTEEKTATNNSGNANEPVNGNNEKKETANKAEAPGAGGGKGLMTKEEILGYMRTHGYINGQPKHDPQVCKDLVEQIKRRGVVAPIIPGDDSSFINANGCANAEATDVVGATGDNIGPPTKLDWLMGTWNMTVSTVTTYSASFAKLGFLTINANGTYIWKVDPLDPPAKYVHGNWRKATPDEMGSYGGAGIVLQKGPEDTDWIVFKYMDQFNKADRIDVRSLQNRGMHSRRIGWRR